MVAKAPEGIICDLRHGIQLEIIGEPANVRAEMVGDLLAKAMRHFKQHRDEMKTGLYTGPPISQTYGSGRGKKATRPVTIRVAFQGTADGPHLTAALWVDGVIAAYSCVNTVEQMTEDLGMWKQAVAREGQSPFFREVVGLLDRRGGEMQAARMMLKYSLETDLAAGRYKPGVVLPA